MTHGERDKEVRAAANALTLGTLKELHRSILAAAKRGRCVVDIAATHGLEVAAAERIIDSLRKLQEARDTDTDADDARCDPDMGSDDVGPCDGPEYDEGDIGYEC